MNNIGLIVTLNKFNTYFETKQETFICESEEKAREELINLLVNNFKSLNIDFPQELVDFEYIWFKQQYVNCNCFDYKLFNSKWSEPWEPQDIYSEVLDRMFDEDSKNPPDFSEIYGEPNPDESKQDKFTMENDEKIQELENKLKEIISQAKTAHVKEDQVKECKCEKCQNREVHL